MRGDRKGEGGGGGRGGGGGGGGCGFFFFNDTATTEIYTLSLHDALPIFYACIITDRRGMSENTQKIQFVQCTVRSTGLSTAVKAS